MFATSYVAALVVLLALPSAFAGKYNITTIVKSPLVAGHVPPTETDCLVPGACFPVNQTIPGNSFWYWCGFWSTHKTIYYVKSNNAKVNFTGTWLMRRDVVENCALTDMANVENCATVPESSCSKLQTCDVRLFGLVFADEMCLVIINNKPSSVVATVKVNNFYSSSRYYGTVFTIILAVVGLSCVAAKVSYDMYKGIVTPVSRHKEPVRPKRTRELQQQLLHDEDTEKGKTTSAAATENTQAGGNQFFARMRAYLVRQKAEA